MNYLNELIGQQKRMMNDESVDMVLNYYDTGNYISDCIHEQAENEISIYTWDLIDWARNNYDYIDEAIRAFGKPDNFLDYIRQAQYLEADERMHSDALEIIQLSALLFIRDREEGLDESDVDSIMNGLRDDFDEFDEIKDFVNDEIDLILEEKEDQLVINGSSIINRVEA